MLSKSLLVSGSLLAACAVTSPASAVGFHLEGTLISLWIGDVETLDTNGNAAGGTDFSAMTPGTGMPMDLNFALPDGTVLDGSDVSSQMVMGSFTGDVGDSTLGLPFFGAWIDFFDLASLHVTIEFTPASSELFLTGANADGTFDYHGDLVGTATAEYIRADGSVETLTGNAGSLTITNLPSPGAVALFGLAGMTAARRRR